MLSLCVFHCTWPCGAGHSKTTPRWKLAEPSRWLYSSFESLTQPYIFLCVIASNPFVSRAFLHVLLTGYLVLCFLYMHEHARINNLVGKAGRGIGSVVAGLLSLILLPVSRQSLLLKTFGMLFIKAPGTRAGALSGERLSRIFNPRGSGCSSPPCAGFFSASLKQLLIEEQQGSQGETVEQKAPQQKEG